VEALGNCPVCPLLNPALCTRIDNWLDAVVPLPSYSTIKLTTLKISKFTYKNIHTFFIVSRITHYVSHNGNVNPVVKLTNQFSHTTTVFPQRGHLRAMLRSKYTMQWCN